MNAARHNSSDLAGDQSPRAASVLASFCAPIHVLFRSRELIYYLTRQKLVLQYRGSLLGAAWFLLAPALTLGIYTLVFGVIFKPRWSDDSMSTVEYALILYLGLCVYWFVSDCIGEAPGLIRQNPSYVKKVVFPLDVLAWVSVCTALVHTTLRLLVFALALVIFGQSLPPTILLVAPAFIPLALLVVALIWMLSAVGVFVRDLAEIVTLGLTAMLFLSPVFYRIDSVPESFRWLIYANPITIPIEQIRQVAYFGTIPDPKIWLAFLGITYLAAWAGHSLFERCRKAFPDEL